MTRFMLVPVPPTMRGRPCDGYEVECQEPATYAIGAQGGHLACPITAFCDACSKRVAQRGDIGAPSD